MNILYFSHLSNKTFAGPNFSVPAGIKAQQAYDNCLWIDQTNAFQAHWGEVESYHNYREFSESIISLDQLPYPFNKPDVVVFEGFYSLKEVQIAKSLHRKGIPYVIVPRGSLTKQAMRNKAKLKKRIAHWLYFDKYCKNAAAIQYLTYQEYRDSYKKWNDTFFIIPNGFDRPDVRKTRFSDNGMKMVFIGRPDMFHKGLDLLWKSLIEMKNELVQSDITLDFYAPQNESDYSDLKHQVDDFQMNDIIKMHDKVGGKDKEQALLDADLFVLTSRFEGHPMGLVEALSYGLPAFVTPGSNMADEILQADAGWIADCSVEGIKNSLRKVIGEKALLHRKSKNALQLSSRYHWDIVAKSFHEKLEELICGL